MEFFKIHRDYNFMRYALVLNIVSFLTFALAVFFLVTRGLHLSVEFTGGTVVEVAYTQPADLDKVRGAMNKMGYADAQVQLGICMRVGINHIRLRSLSIVGSATVVQGAAPHFPVSVVVHHHDGHLRQVLVVGALLPYRCDEAVSCQ